MSERTTLTLDDLKNTAKSGLNSLFKKRNTENPSFLNTLRSNNVRIILGTIGSPLDVLDMPTDILLIKTLSPHKVIFHDGIFDKEIYKKITHIPIVTSSYVGKDSFSLFSVGIVYEPTRILAAFPSDIASTATTLIDAPSLEELRLNNKVQYQLVDWDGVRKCSQISVAAQLNLEYWYPEIWIEGYPKAVMVRPYDALVSRSQQYFSRGGDFKREEAANHLAEMYGLPINVLP
ncbi:MAG: hypothetical protein Q7R95_08360 [bacterium]|nr:hypothetical protein [bacterium]